MGGCRRPRVDADAATALAERISITPANVNDGRAGPDALPDDPGEVFADSAYRGSHFGGAVRAKGGTPRVVATGIWSRDERKRSPASMPGISRSTACAARSRRSSAPANAATACAECDGAASPKPPSSPPHRPKMNPVRHPQDPDIGSLRGIMIKTMYFRGLHPPAHRSPRRSATHAPARSRVCRRYAARRTRSAAGSGRRKRK